MSRPAAPPLRHSSRDPHELARRLQSWLRQRIGDDDAVVGDVAASAANGMSSDTVLFAASWHARGRAEAAELVARLAPDPADVPVFERYDLPAQFDTLAAVRASSDVPVPEPLWCEPDPSFLGCPFFVMRKVPGRVPPDVLPYTFGRNWLYDAGPAEQRLLQDATVDALAALHAIPDAPARFPSLRRDAAGATPLARHVGASRRWYSFVAAGGAPCPLVEQAFDELARRLPAGAAAEVLSWGDARIGNVVYDGLRPAALLDWEMAGLGPAELDVGWLICSHLVFQHLAASVGLDGMPEFLREDDVVARYERSGRRLAPLGFFVAYAAVLWAVVLLRTGTRQVHFGERPAPARPEEFLLHRPLLERLLAV